MTTMRRPVSTRTVCLAWVLVAAGACGEGDPDDGDPTAVTTDPTVGSSEEGSSSSGAADGSTGAVTTDDGGDVTSTGGGPVACEPPMAAFLMSDASVLQASIELGADACSVVSLEGAAPQIVFEVRPTGLVEATLYGLALVSSSAGQPFEDPPVGDAVVIDLITDLPITFETTRIDGGTPVTIAFQISSAGPTLVDVRAEFG